MIDSYKHRSGDHAAPEADASNGFSGRTVVSAMRCWWKVATPIALICAVAAGGATMYTIKPKYTAAAWLIIRDRSGIFSEGMPQESPQKFVENQLELIRSLFVLEPVASNPAIAETPELKNELDRVQALRKQLKIKAVGRSDFFTIEYTSIDNSKAATIVNEVANAYLKLQERTSSAKSAEVIGILRTEQAAQEVSVETLRNNLEELTKQLTGKDLHGVQSKANVIELRNAMADLQSRLLDAELEQRMLGVQLEVEKEALAKEVFDPLPGELDRQLEAMPKIQALRESVSQINSKLKDFERAAQNPAKNPAYQSLAQQAKLTGEQLDAARIESREQLKVDLIKFNRGRREDQVAELSRRLASADYTVKILNDRLGSEMKGQKQYKGETLQLEFVRADYERAKKIHESITDRIHAMQMANRAPAGVEIFKEADPPAGPSDASPLKKVLLATAFGLMAPFCLAVGFEHLRQRVSSSQQLETAGRIPVIGEVTTLPRRTGSIGKAAKANLEFQLFEESINGLRTHLTLLHSSGMQVLAVTSAVSGEGKTSLASQLAVSLASATGEPTLLIDGDMRSPDIHRIFEVDRGDGLAEVLLGTALVEEAIEVGFSQNLHLLTSGDLRTSPHRLLGGSSFASMIEKLRLSYRHIIIDTPPVLCASESLVLARAADVSVVCVRRDYSRCDQTREAIQRLNSSGAKAISAVLTGVPTRTYAQKYGNYYYTRRIDNTHQPEVNA